MYDIANTCTTDPCAGTNQSGEWKRLHKELSRRLREPTERVIFMVYFFAVVIVLGGMGWIIPLCRLVFYRDLNPVSELPSALSTFALALLASSMAEIVLGENVSPDGASPQDTSKSFRVFAFGMSLLGIPLAFAGIQRNTLLWAYVAGCLVMMISLFLWWVLNADSGKWRDKVVEPVSATGGATSVELKGSVEGLTA